jgi:hypothetical protein
MIEVEALTKRYGKTQALAGVDFSVPAGTLLGLLGPNGAGKPNIGFWHFFAHIPRGRSQQPPYGSAVTLRYPCLVAAVPDMTAVPTAVPRSGRRRGRPDPSPDGYSGRR